MGYSICRRKEAETGNFNSRFFRRCCSRWRPFLLQCFVGGMLFDWNYREPLLFLACLFAGMVLLGIFRIIELLEQR
ncbi:MAG: hypothetical protein ACLRRT_13220 [Ruthenibacterium lactatiformans]